MKNIHIFNHHHYHETLNEQIGKGIPVFVGSRQKGGGLGSILGLIGRYVIPLLQKYVFPHAKNAIVNTVSDLAQGKPLSQTLKNQTLGMLKNVGTSLTKPQKGSGLKDSKIKRIGTFECGMGKKRKQTKAKKNIKKKPKLSTKKPKSKTKPLSKRDIFG